MHLHIFSHLNWLAVLVAALAYFILGAIWYSKPLFAVKWAAYVGLDMNNPDKGKGLAKMMIATLILILITCISQALLVHRMDLFIWQSALHLGLLTGFGFAVTAMSISFIYESRPFGLYLIDGGYHLVGHLISAFILVLWR